MKRKKSMQPTPSPCSSPKLDVNLELDIKALRGKNKQLTQAVAKLQQDKKSQQDQITSLQEEFFNLNSKYVNLKNIFSNIDVATKVMFPKQVELAELFGRIMQLCAVGATVSNLNKDPITQTVKPHIVNGHVLQNPTITLARLNDSPSRTPPRSSGNRNNSPENNMSQRRSNDRRTTSNELVLPGSSRNTMREDDGREADSPPMVTRRRATNSEGFDAANSSQNESLEEEEDNTDAEYCSRLVTIQEEDEEQYSMNLSPANTSQSGLSGRVREIRIFLDPLPKESIEAKNNVSHSRSYINCSVSDEPSTSAMNVSRQILNSSLGSPDDTMKFITSAIDSQTFSFNTSSPLKAGYFQGNRSSTSSLNDSVGINRVQMTRGKYGKSEEKPQKAELESNTSIMSSSSISSVRKLPNISDDDTSFFASTSMDLDLEASKVNTLKSLGLEPSNSQLMITSTPVVNSPRSSLRIKKLDSSIEKITRLSPSDSKVTKRRGGSNEKKIVQVLLKRVSAEKRLSGSPLLKVRELTGTPPITRSSDLKRSKRSTDNAGSSNGRRESNSPKQTRTTSKPSSARKNKTVVKKKGKENRIETKPTIQIKSSPRPRRAVRPTELKEPSLNKKLRRSR